MAQVQTRMTRQRAVILEELRKTKSHPTADELYSIVRERLPRTVSALCTAIWIFWLTAAKYVAWRPRALQSVLTATFPGISMCVACSADASGISCNRWPPRPWKACRCRAFPPSWARALSLTASARNARAVAARKRSRLRAVPKAVSGRGKNFTAADKRLVVL